MSFGRGSFGTVPFGASPVATAGIAFDAASNAGYNAAASSYTLSRTVSGSNTFLSVDVHLLSVPGTTVTSVIDDSTGAAVAMTFIGAQSTVSGAGRVECWGLANPGAGTKTIQVNLSAAIASTATAASYTGVHQTSPYEAFNSAQATNVGAADATVSITSVADNCWVHGACATDDTAITAGQTSRNNVSGASGSGANEDNGGPKTPAGAVTISYTGVGALATWAIAGYALRPLAASGLGNSVTPGVGSLSITGYSPTIAQTANQSITPGAGSLALTGYAPAVTQSDNRSVAPGAGSLSLTGYAPTIAQTANINVNPGAGTLALTGYAPTVARTDNQFIAPGAGILSITGYAPTVTQTSGTSVFPGTGAMGITGYAPLVEQTANQVVSPGAGSLTITGYAPTVTQSAPPLPPRYARPDADVAPGAWLPSAGSTLFDMIDEPTADDTDFIYTNSASACEIALNPVADPGTSAGQVVRYRIWSPFGNAITVRLMQGTTVIASWAHATMPLAPTTFAQELTAAQANSITDYGNLHFAFEAA